MMEHKPCRKFTAGALCVMVAFLCALSFGACQKDENLPTDPVLGNQNQANTETQATGNQGVQTPTDSQDTTEPVYQGPSEENPVYLDDNLCVVHTGNFSGRYVEDASDVDVDSVASIVVENRGKQTVRLAQFQLVMGGETYSFRLTTLPPGQKAIVQDLDKKSIPGDLTIPIPTMEVLAYFPEEPQLYEDIFAITGAESAIELRNRTDADIEGPIYVYYKTRTAEGFAGGITYRVTFSGLKAGEAEQIYANHFWAGSSQVMFIEYAG